MSLTKVIIWGYPLHSHTHSYVHYGWYKTFTALGYEAYWFDDNQHPNPQDFDYTNCLFITEGYADAKIPMHESNVYFVHVCKNPAKYIASGARLIDIRYHVKSIYDCNYQYSTIEKEANGRIIKISHSSKYEPEATDRDLNRSWWVNPSLTYEAVYIYWATDLLPSEINLDDRFIAPASTPTVVYIGTIGGGNQNEVYNMIHACKQLRINFAHVDPWKAPVSCEENRTLVQQSIIAPDIRGSGENERKSMGDTGTNHKQNGYVPCRIFKNISYGKFCATNSMAVWEALGAPDILPCEEDEFRLVNLCLQEHKNYDLIKKQMEWVRDKHTYVNRIEDLLAVLAQKDHTLAKKQTK